MKMHLLAFAALVTLGSTAASADARQERSERFAKCAVERDPTTIERGLAGNWAPEKFIYELDRGAFDRCLEGMPGLAMYSPDLRHVLAAEWLKRNDALRQPADFAAVPPLSHEVVSAPVLRALPRTVASEDFNTASLTSATKDATFSQIGECVVRRDPETIRQFLAASDRAAATASVVPLLSGCIPADTQVQLRRDSLAGLLALSYARLYLAAQPPRAEGSR